MTLERTALSLEGGASENRLFLFFMGGLILVGAVKGVCGVCMCGRVCSCVGGGEG